MILITSMRQHHLNVIIKFSKLSPYMQQNNPPENESGGLSKSGLYPLALAMGI